jgi:hypothetical protein
MATAHTSLPTGTVLRSGEAAQSSLAALKDKSAKTYHHMVKGAKFFMPDGLAVEFLGGQFVTTDADIIAELDKVANKPASMIYTRKDAVEAVQSLMKQAADDAVQKSAKPE